MNKISGVQREDPGTNFSFSFELVRFFRIQMLKSTLGSKYSLRECKS